jgi:hypothetical protein
MKTKKRPTRPKSKVFDVAYCIEQDFSIEVRAKSTDDAERIIEKRLEDECDVLPGSTRVHYEGFTAGAYECEVRS